MIWASSFQTSAALRPSVEGRLARSANGCSGRVPKLGTGCSMGLGSCLLSSDMLAPRKSCGQEEGHALHACPALGTHYRASRSCNRGLEFRETLTLRLDARCSYQLFPLRVAKFGNQCGLLRQHFARGSSDLAGVLRHRQLGRLRFVCHVYLLCPVVMPTLRSSSGISIAG